MESGEGQRKRKRKDDRGKTSQSSIDKWCTMPSEPKAAKMGPDQNMECQPPEGEVNAAEVDVDVTVFDIGSCNKTTLSDTEQFQLLTNHVKPDGKAPLAYQEVTKSGKISKVNFQLSWLQEFPWLVYSPSQKGGYCKYCALYGSSKHAALGVLVTIPFRKFKYAKGKDGVLSNHVTHKYHQEASDRAHMFISTYQKPQTRIDARISIEAQKLSETNRHILGEIVQTIILLARQGLSLRGHRDDSTANQLENRGNFIALLEHTADRDPILKEHLQNGNRNGRYTSKTIQNDIILTAAECLKERLLQPLHETTFYSIIADEVTDHYSNQEVLSLCIRFLDLSTDNMPHIKEVFLDFIHLKRATGKLVAQAIRTVLNRNGLDVQNIRGQAYDGASAMSSNNIGTQAQIKSENPLALYTHCRSHVLNLAVAGSCKTQSLRNVIGVINELYLFFHLSPKRQRYLEFVLRVYAPENKVKKLKGLCKTRWVERHDCLETLVSLYKYVVTCLHSMVMPSLYPLLTEAPDGVEGIDQDDDEMVDYEPWNWDRETLVKAEGLKYSLTSATHIAALVTMKNGLHPVKALSVKLQKRDNDICRAYSHIDFVISEVKSMRTDIDAVWDEWFNEASAIAEDVGATMETPRTTTVQQNRANVPADTPSTYYKRVVAVPFLDSFSQGLTERFSPENRRLVAIMGLVPSICLSSTTPVDEEVQALMFWEADLPSPVNLKVEIGSWKRYWGRMDAANLPDDIVDCIPHADVDLFPNIRVLLIVGCTSPVTSCEAERSFSALRRVATHLRSTMGEERLAGLTLMAVHYQETMQLDPQKVVESFSQKQPRRLFCKSIIFD